MLYCIVLLGIDRLVRNNFRPLKGMRVGLLTNTSCCNSELKPTISIFEKSKEIDLKAVFAPEHGLFTALQDQVKAPDTTYHRKYKIHSMYGPRRKPRLKTLKSLDAVVIDLPDIGTRYYTFLWSAMLMIEAAAKAQTRIFLLDRPNPLGGIEVQGPMIDPGFESFVGLYSVPVRHGMTIAELCSMLNQIYRLRADIRIVPMKGWQRSMYWNDYSIPWTMPSPNMPSFSTALVYPGMCLIEGTNVSEGRGTTRPFELIGAPWIDPEDLTRNLQKSGIPGVTFRPAYFMPTFHKFRSTLCGGIQVHVTNHRKHNPFITGLQIIKNIHDMYHDDFQWRQPPYEYEREKLPFDILIGNQWLREDIKNRKSMRTMEKKWQGDLLKFKKSRKKYLLYD